jgi:serine/threonine protein kinase
LLTSVERGASLITYDVLLGPYIVGVKMLNIDDHIFQESGQSLGKGSFGSIVPLRDELGELVAKRIKFREKLQLMSKNNNGQEWSVFARFSEVERVIVEYAIAKVCSMLGIAPQIKTDIGFDLVCYRDCIEFYMERCWPSAGLSSKGDIEDRLKYCVAVMHEHRLIHRDIKPANIVWSANADDYVLCDFGVSCTVLEPVGFKTLTEAEGTEKYMTAELKCLTGKGYADLYHADMFALSMAIE